jgi:hypothetical protein
VARMKGQLTFLTDLNHARREHGCSKVVFFINIHLLIIVTRI